jgi:hypothetical protein
VRPCGPLTGLSLSRAWADAKELSDKGDLILVNVADGEIAPAEASSLMNAISSQARILEVDELERRITELESSK